MIPLSDDNPRILFPIVTLCLIGACVLVFFWEMSLTEEAGKKAILSFGLIPARFFGEVRLATEVMVIPAWATVITSLFLHAGLLHLGENMLFLWIFGDNIEGAMGHLRFFAFYLFCGIAAAFAQVAANPSAAEPMIGASGAISGVLGAYLILYPRANVRTLIFLGIFVTVIRIPAFVILGLWFLVQFWNALGPGSSEAEGVAFWAHVGGFIAGVILVLILKRPDIELFQPARFRAFSRETS
jgi:membrane associated rhomboid family serine protease